MTQYHIAVLVGSLRKDSFNKKLATALAKLAPADFTFKQVPMGDLPLYNQDDDAHQAASVLHFKSEIKAAHGLLFVTPEYNRSIPGVLKNALDGVVGGVARRHRHRPGTAAPAQCAGLPERTHLGPARGFYPGQRRPV